MENEFTKKKKCNSCKTLIDVEANVCPSCQRNQKFFTKDIFYTPNFLTIISLLISIILLALSFMEYAETKRERVETTIALEKADLSLKQSQVIKKEVQEIALDLIKIIEITKGYIEESVKRTIVDDFYNFEKVKTLNKKIKNDIEQLKKTIEK